MRVAANTSAPPSDVGLSALLAAYLPVHVACSAWGAALYVAGQVDAPAVTLPCSRVAGTLVVTALYLLLCAGFLVVIPLDRRAKIDEAGSIAGG
jgi:APA family basic amino acid/polyamine antiporter